jgi:Zn-finger nucleic acid-binding protein
MVVVEHSKIELDYCTNCHGVWFDAGELELLLESMALESLGLLLSDVLSAPEAESAEKKRKCPICGQKMKKTTIGQQPEILIDVCRRGDGLWFDGGEVHQLVAQLTQKGDKQMGGKQRMLTFLGDTFKAR